MLSILTRKLKPGKSFEDFKRAHVPVGDSKKTEFGYDIDFFRVPTRVINAVSCEDPSVVYSIGLSYGTVEQIFSEAKKSMEKESQPDQRSDRLDKICDDITKPVIAFVGADNNYGGSDPEYKQLPLAKITPKLIETVQRNLKAC